MYALARSVLFALDAEQAHWLTLAGLRGRVNAWGCWAWRPLRNRRNRSSSWGSRSPIASVSPAGFDKNATCVDAIGALVSVSLKWEP